MIAALVVAVACWAPPVEAPVTRPFVRPPCQWCPGHRGVAFATVPGTAVRAIAPGVVTFAGAVAGRRFVTVTDDDGLQVTYGYLATVAVRAGVRVPAGVLLGTTGDPLLLTVRVNGEYVDPAAYLGRWRWPTRLVPVDGSPAPPAPPPVLVCRA